MSEMQESILESIPKIPIGFCQCGCGKQTGLAKRTRQRKNFRIIKGQLRPYINGHYHTGKKRPPHVIEAIKKATSGANHYNYDGGVHKRRYRQRDVRWQVSTHNHGVVFYSYVVMEDILGHEVPKGMIVHHINGNSEDDRPENLTLMTQSDHSKLHKARGGLNGNHIIRDKDTGRFVRKV